MEKAVEENPLVVSDLRYWCIIRNRNKRVAKGNVSTCVCVCGGGGGWSGVEGWRDDCYRVQLIITFFFCF